MKRPASMLATSRAGLTNTTVRGSKMARNFIPRIVENRKPSAPEPRDACYVYVIQITGQDICKVGISNNPQGRLSQLLTGSPFEMEMVHMFRIPNREMARELEASFHGFMNKHRTRGEWFALDRKTVLENMIYNLITNMKQQGIEDRHINPLLREVGWPEGFLGYANSEGVLF
jgi:hypothetical protein